MGTVYTARFSLCVMALCSALDRVHFGPVMQLSNGASVCLDATDFEKTKHIAFQRALQQRLRSHRVIIADPHLPLLQEMVRKMPSTDKVRLSSLSVLAMVAAGNNLVVAVGRTFLHVCQHDDDTWTVSTSAVRGHVILAD